MMAKIVLGLGTSHTPMLLASDETLQRFIETDRNIKHRDKEGRPVTYGDLLEKADPKLAHIVAPQHLVERQNVARSRHPSGVNVCQGDGSVRFVSNSINLIAWRALGSMDGGEVLVGDVTQVHATNLGGERSARRYHRDARRSGVTSSHCAHLRTF